MKIIVKFYRSKTLNNCLKNTKKVIADRNLVGCPLFSGNILNGVEFLIISNFQFKNQLKSFT